MSRIEGHDIFQTAMGWMGVVTSDAGILYCVLPRDRSEDVVENIETHFGSSLRDNANGGLVREIRDAMVSFFEGKAVDLKKFPLDLSRVSPFNKRVYEVVSGIERGRVMSYGGVAKRAGNPAAPRAVGSAMAGNPFPPFVPCHRVVGKSGALVGFGGGDGLSMKEKMLRLEGIYSVNGTGVGGSPFRVSREFFKL